MDDNFKTGTIAFVVVIAVIIIMALWADRKHMTIKSLTWGLLMAAKEALITIAFFAIAIGGIYFIGWIINLIWRVINV